MHWLRRWAPAAVWAAAISVFSTGGFSAASTTRFILPILRSLFPEASYATLQLWHHYIRKSAHFTEYFVLGLLVFRGIRGERRGWRSSWALATVLVAACYAALDEIHQAFVPGRTASAWDSMLDTTGAIGAQIVVWVVARWYDRRARRAAAEHVG